MYQLRLHAIRKCCSTGQNTGQPIDHVEVKRPREAQYPGVASDSIGRIRLTDMVGPKLINGYPDIPFIFDYAGYKLKTFPLIMATPIMPFT